MKGSYGKGKTSKQISTGKGQSGAADNYQIEYVHGRFYRLVGDLKTEFTPDRELLMKIKAALRKKAMTLEDIAEDQPPVDFQVLSSGKVVLRQIYPDK
ncbi:MAG TPA: hypothetical protein PKN50_14980 [Spirochaetota bacterium]|nr:hypothetical protein [Spirochaetota bacterium]HPV43072.1 hypothetical protein [Spirochaetota bacterium]